MTAAKLDLAIEQGATWRHTLQLKSGDGESAPALDLTGYSARMQLRANVLSESVLLELTNANARITITPLAGTLDLLVSAADTGSMTYTKAVYDLEIESAGGEVTRVLQGSVTVSRQVTR